MTTTHTTTLTWKRSKDGWGCMAYSTVLADGRRVTIRATGARNGRMLGLAFQATSPDGSSTRTVASSGTLHGCKAAVEALNAEVQV